MIYSKAFLGLFSLILLVLPVRAFGLSTNDLPYDYLGVQSFIESDSWLKANIYNNNSGGWDNYTYFRVTRPKAQSSWQVPNFCTFEIVFYHRNKTSQPVIPYPFDTSKFTLSFSNATDNIGFYKGGLGTTCTNDNVWRWWSSGNTTSFQNFFYVSSDITPLDSQTIITTIPLVDSTGNSSQYWSTYFDTNNNPTPPPSQDPIYPLPEPEPEPEPEPDSGFVWTDPDCGVNLFCYIPWLFTPSENTFSNFIDSFSTFQDKIPFVFFQLPALVFSDLFPQSLNYSENCNSGPNQNCDSYILHNINIQNTSIQIPFGQAFQSANSAISGVFPFTMRQIFAFTYYFGIFWAFVRVLTKSNNS